MFPRVQPAATSLFVLALATTLPAQVVPDPASLLFSKRVLVINGTDAANTAHGASRRVLSQRLNQMKAQVGFQLDSITGTATPPTDLGTYDIIVFNYWFHSGYVANEVFQTGFRPFAEAFKAWMTEPGKQRGWLGVHSSAANEAGEWNWFRDSVSSMHYALHGAGTPAGTIRRTADPALREHDILNGLPDTMRVNADEWYTFTLTAPTWKDVRVIYSLDESTLSTPLEPEYSMAASHPMAWFREDPATGNRFFYTGLIHQNTGGATAFAEFYAGMVLRALEYLAGSAPLSIRVDGSPFASSRAAAPVFVREGAITVSAAEDYALAIHATDGRRVFAARGPGRGRAGEVTYTPAVLRTPGVYILSVAGAAGQFRRTLVVP